MPQRCMCPNFNRDYRMVAALQRRELNMFSLGALVRINHSRANFTAESTHAMCFVVYCCGYIQTVLPISFRISSLALWQSYDCLNATEATLMNMNPPENYDIIATKWIKHKKIVCIFYGILCISRMDFTSWLTGSLWWMLDHHQFSYPPWQNGCLFTVNIFGCIFLNENFCILIKISLKCVPKGPIDNNPALVQIMAWCRICGTRERWAHLSFMMHICVKEFDHHRFHVMACHLFGTKPLPEPRVT